MLSRIIQIARLLLGLPTQARSATEGGVFPTTIHISPRPIYSLVTGVYNTLGALAGLLVLSPLMLVIGVAVKMSSPGPIFYRGARVGRGETRFNIYKFRTMKVGSEAVIGKRLVQQDEDHYTSIGRFLRKFRLDELPQLFNVVFRHMNLVGPRPVRPIFLDDHKVRIPGYARRFLVRPGITGQAQVRGGYYTSPRHKLFYEMLYISRRTVLFDLQLIILTFVRVMTRIFTATLLLGWLLVMVLLCPPDITENLTIELMGFSFNFLYLIPTLIVLSHLLRRQFEQRKVSAMRTPIDVPLLGFLIWTAILIPLSPHPLGALRGLGWYLCNGVVVFYLVLNSRMVTTGRNNIINVLVIATALMGAFSLFPTLYEFVQTGSLSRVTGPLFSPILMAAIVLLALPLAIVRARHSDLKQGRLLFILAAAVLFVIGVMTLSRVGLVAMAITLAIVYAGQKKRLLLGISIAFVLAISLMFIQGDERLAPERITQDVSLLAQKQARVFTALSADERVSPHHWATGLGARVLGRFEQSDRYRNQRIFLRMENMYLTVLVDQGPIGLIFFLAFLVGSIAHMFRTARELEDQGQRDHLRATAAGVVGCLLLFFFSDGLYYLPLMITFFAALGLGVGMATHYREGNRPIYRIIHYRHQL